MFLYVDRSCLLLSRAHMHNNSRARVANLDINAPRFPESMHIRSRLNDVRDNGLLFYKDSETVQGISHTIATLA